jgi:hypothetical protein
MPISGRSSAILSLYFAVMKDIGHVANASTRMQDLRARRSTCYVLPTSDFAQSTDPTTGLDHEYRVQACIVTSGSTGDLCVDRLPGIVAWVQPG